MIKKCFIKNSIKKFTTKLNQNLSLSSDQQMVTPWKVEGKIDYKKLVEQFGTELLDENVVNKFEKVIKQKVHPWITRNIFFTHRGFGNFLTAYEEGQPVFLYTGRGPSSEAMHLGHLIPFIFTKWLQDIFDCPLIIQISDEEKSAFKQKNFNEIYKLGFDNAKDIISCGFDPKKTFIFSNRDYRLKCKNFELLASEMKNLTSLKEVKKIFGLGDEASIAMYDWPFYQTAAAYYMSFPHIFDDVPAYCLVPHAIDQDPYFRLARDLSPKMNLYKPSNIMSTFVPSLSGNDGKMSSSIGQENSIFLNDSIKKIREKVMKNSFSGGGGDGSLSDHKKFGGNPHNDIAFQYLRYLEMDDKKLENIREAFIKGELSCGEMKNLLLDKLIPLISEIQERRSKVDNNMLNEFYEHKSMDCIKKKSKDNNKMIKSEDEIKLYKFLNDLDIQYRTIYHSDFNLIEKDIEKEKNLKMSLNGVLCKSILLKSQGKDYFLCIMNFDTKFNLQNFKKKLGLNRLNAAEKDTIRYLFSSNISNTSNTTTNFKNNFILSVFSILNFKNNQSIDYSDVNLTIFIENSLDNYKNLNFHPIRSDATTTISYKDTIKFISKLNVETKLISFEEID